MDQTATLYKYRAWENEHHRNVLLKNELYFASPSEINDPFDFKITADLSLLENDEERLLYIDKVISDAELHSRWNHQQVSWKRAELLKRFQSEEAKLQLEFDATNSLWTNNRFGVISLSERWDSVLMWSHYSNNHKGFCVGFDKEALVSQCLRGTAGPVQYDTDYPRIHPLKTPPREEIFLRSHTKVLDWQYEKEYRFTSLWTDKTPTVEERKVFFSDKCYKEVILGLCIDQQARKDIIKIAESKGIPVYEIHRHRNTFNLVKTLVAG